MNAPTARRTPVPVQLALGRIFGMMQRPEQPGDVAEYARCRSIVLDHSDHIDATDRSPNWIRDSLSGAQGA